MSTETPKHDERARIEEHDGRWLLAGGRCTECGYPVAYTRPWCPVCRAVLAPELFGPNGSVWAATVQRTPVPGLDAGTSFAYVDLDNGPRLLLQISAASAPPPPGVRVTLEQPSPQSGNPTGKVVAS